MNEILKILFLDINGVLNNTSYIHCELHNKKNDGFINNLNMTNKKYEEIKQLQMMYEWIDNKTLVILNKIIKSTKCKVVISSSWRIKYYESLKNNLTLLGFEGEIIDRTIIEKNSDNYEDWHEGRRGREIKQYLDTHNITNYCILDDYNDILEEQLNNFVQTDTNKGLTEKEMFKVINILNK